MNLKDYPALKHKDFFVMAPSAFQITESAIYDLVDLIEGYSHPEDLAVNTIEELIQNHYLSLVISDEGEIKEFSLTEDLISDRLENLYNNYLSKIQS